MWKVTGEDAIICRERLWAVNSDPAALPVLRGRQLEKQDLRLIRRRAILQTARYEKFTFLQLHYPVPKFDPHPAA